MKKHKSIWVTYLTPFEMEKKYYGLYIWRLLNGKRVFRRYTPLFLSKYVSFSLTSYLDTVWIVELGLFEHGYVYERKYTFWHGVWNPSGFLGTREWIEGIKCCYGIALCVLNHVMYKYVSCSPGCNDLNLWFLSLLPMYENSLENCYISLLAGKLFCSPCEEPIVFRLKALRGRFGESRPFWTK